MTTAATDDSGDVYFDVKSFPEYGSLTHQKIDDMEAAQDAGRRRGQVRLHEARLDARGRGDVVRPRGSEGARPPQLTEDATPVGVADDGTEPHAGQPAGAGAGQVLAHPAADACWRRSDGR